MNKRLTNRQRMADQMQMERSASHAQQAQFARLAISVIAAGLLLVALVILWR